MHFYGSGTKYSQSFCNTGMLGSSRPVSSTNGWRTRRVREACSEPGYATPNASGNAAVVCEEHHGEYCFALETYRSFAGKKRSSDLLGMATSLLAYCNTHRLDPDNSLIGATSRKWKPDFVGLSPSLRALQSCTEEERTAKRRHALAEGDLLLVEVTMDQDSEVRFDVLETVLKCWSGSLAVCPRRTFCQRG